MQERLWSVQRGTARMEAVLEDFGVNGVEIRIVATGELPQVNRFVTRELAVAHADERLRFLQSDGWG